MQTCRILIVDDEVEFVELLAKRLRNRDLKVDCSYTGEGAITVLKKEVYDIVVLDVKMPGMDGIETLKEVKKMNPDIEVIMLTGHATLDTAVEGMKHDAFDYLVKPIDINFLIQKIRDAYNKRHHSNTIDFFKSQPENIQ